MLFQVPVIGKGREQSQEKASRTHQHRPCAKAPGQQITGKKQGQWQQIDRRGSPQHRSALQSPLQALSLRTTSSALPSGKSSVTVAFLRIRAPLPQ